MNNSSKFCLNFETAGQRVCSSTDLFLCAKVNKHPQGLSLIFFYGFEIQDVTFPTNQVASNLDYTWTFKSANKPKVSDLPSRTRIRTVLV